MSARANGEVSFSRGVKDELARIFPEDPAERSAELAAFLVYGTRAQRGADGTEVRVFTTEHSATARKYFTVLKKTDKIGSGVSVRQHSAVNRGCSYTVMIGKDTADELMREASEIDAAAQPEEVRRAFVRGAFLSAGSVSDPGKSYHFEIVCQDRTRAETLCGVVSSLGPEARVVSRKKLSVVYLKESDGIVELFGHMGASSALMELENVRILKDITNNVNRRVNCEAANISKTVGAAVRQVRDIEYIRDTVGFGGLKDELREAAEVRLAFPEISLKELGEHMDPRVGKSGVNHRLRKLSDYAEQLRKEHTTQI